MLKNNKSMNYSATSETIEGQVIAYFSANSDEQTHNFSTSLNVADQELYKQNEVTVNADWNAFLEIIYKDLGYNQD